MGFLSVLAAVAVAGGLYRHRPRPSQNPLPRISDRSCRGGCGGAGPLVALFTKAVGLAVPSDTANPLVGSPSSFCLVANAAASGNGWADSTTAGIFNIGAPFPGANGLSLYRISSSARSLWEAKFYNSAGVLSDTFSSVSIASDGDGANPTHQVAYCVNAGTYKWYRDGLATPSTSTLSTSYTFANTMEVAGLGGLSFGYGSSNPLSSVCIAGGTGVTSAVFTTAISNVCGQFTDTHDPLAPQYACYGCTRSTPPTNAVKMLTEGDSITNHGSNSPRPYPAKLNALLGANYVVTNDGVDGSAVAQIKARYDASFHVANTFNRCIFLGGVNDIIRDGSTAAATYTTASALLDEMRADNCRPIVILPTPAANSTAAGWTAARQTEYDSYRTSLSGYCSTNAATTTCVDTYPTMGAGLPVALIAADDSADHLHPSQAGLDQIAALVKGVLAPLFTSVGPFASPTDTANVLAGNPQNFCFSVTASATGSGWADSQGAAGMANFGNAFGTGNNEIGMYRVSDASSCYWDVKFYNGAGGLVDSQSVGKCFAPVEQTTYCVNAGSYFWYQNGVQTSTGTLSTSYALPNVMEMAGLGNFANGYSATNPMTKVCVAGATGTASVNPTIAISNSCNQFTNTTSALAPQYACYGCLGSTPGGTPTKALALGDSITQFGIGSPRPYPAKLNALLGATYAVTNSGSSGATVAFMKGTYDTSYHTINSFSRCIFQGGGVDIILNGSTAAATYTTASALLDEMRADNCKPIVVMPTPVASSASWTSAKQTQYDSYRTSLTSYCTTNAATTTCVNTDSLGTGSPLALIGSNDGFHPTQAGLDSLAALVMAPFP